MNIYIYKEYQPKDSTILQFVNHCLPSVNHIVYFCNLNADLNLRENYPLAAPSVSILDYEILVPRRSTIYMLSRLSSKKLNQELSNTKYTHHTNSVAGCACCMCCAFRVASCLLAPR